MLDRLTRFRARSPAHDGKRMLPHKKPLPHTTVGCALVSLHTSLYGGGRWLRRWRSTTANSANPIGPTHYSSLLRERGRGSDNDARTEGAPAHCARCLSRSTARAAAFNAGGTVAVSRRGFVPSGRRSVGGHLRTLSQ
jgi:hypothetical protein